MRVTETFQLPKSPGRVSEDALVMTDSYIAVIDGATAKDALLWDGVTPGRRAAVIIAGVIRSMAPTLTMDEFIALSTDAIMAEYVRAGRAETVRLHPWERISASVVVYSATRREVWLVGDAMCMVGGKCYHNAKLIDTLLADVRTECDHWLLSHGRTEAGLMEHDAGRDIIAPFLREQCFFQNSAGPHYCPYDYCVLDGFPLPRGPHLPASARPLIVDAGAGGDIVLSSDGYPRLFATLRESEDYLADVLAHDRLALTLNKQTKGCLEGQYSYDDRTYVRFRA